MNLVFVTPAIGLILGAVTRYRPTGLASQCDASSSMGLITNALVMVSRLPS